MSEEEFRLWQTKPLLLGDEITDPELEFHETHISYLLMLPDHVYKIKKTLKLPFLDFSELEQRKKACTQEILLNLRTAASVYMDVCEVKKTKQGISLGGLHGVTIDYAVRMKKVNNTLEMDQMLKQDAVSNDHMEALAGQIAQFHQQTFAVRKVWDVQELKDTYNQLLAWSDLAGQALGKEYQQIISDSCRLSDRFLERTIDLINNRSQEGLVRDVHGDLHSRNIFLERPPIIFDCIEFDDELRQIDLLNEVAFFIMDLEFYEADALARHFYKHYVALVKSAGFATVENDALLNYFKMYRASIRAKVSFISLEKEKDDAKRENLRKEIFRYLDLVKRYAALLT